MLLVYRRVIGLARTQFSGSLSLLPTAFYSACSPAKIKEAPILDNNSVMALPDELQVKKKLEKQIMVPVMVDLTPVNGIPDEYLRTRRVRIYQPTKNAMQSGTNNLQHWEIEFDNRLRWENPLMGWTSSGDPLSFLKIRFYHPCEAIDYCQRNGWMWYLDVPRTDREYQHQDYGWNFSWNKRTRVSTK